MGIVAIFNAAIWILILSVGNDLNLVDLFGHQLCWSVLSYYACYMMYDAYISVSLREDKSIVNNGHSAKAMKAAIGLSIIANTGLLMVDVVFNFAYSEETNPTYYYLWKWIFALMSYASSIFICAVMFFIVMSKDRSELSTRPVDYESSN